MSWATPGLAAIVAACLLPPLILLYFLKLRRREQVIPSTLLWKQAVQDMQANAPFQRLRMNLLLFLQLLALLLLFLAIAQPQWEGQMKHSARTVLLIDRSASMTATDLDDGQTSRLDEAKKQAREYVEGMRTGGFLNPLSEPEQVMIVGFAAEAQVYTNFTSSKSQLLEAIDAITPTHETTSIRQALDLARAYSTNTNPEAKGPSIGQPATIVVFSDGRINDLKTQVAKEVIQYRRIGAPDCPDNLGIIQCGARRSILSPNEVQVAVVVSNDGAVERTASLTLTVGSQALAAEQVVVPPAGVPLAASDPDAAPAPADSPSTPPETPTSPRQPGTATVIFKLNQPRGVTLRVQIDTTDPLTADNTAFVVVAPARPLRVGFVGENAIMEDALNALTMVVKPVEKISPDKLQALSESGETQEFDVIVISDVPAATLGPGRYLTFGALPPMEGLTAGPEVPGDAPLAASDPNHPVNRYVNYDQLVIGKHLTMKLPERGRVLVQGVSGPLVAEISQPQMHAVVLPFNVLESNWIFSPSFVIFMTNAVDYLGRIGEALTEESALPGQALTARLPAGAGDIRLTLPTGNELPLAPIDPTLTTYGPLELAGLYTIHYKAPGSSEPQTRDFAVNMSDLDEGAIKPASEIKMGLDDVASINPETALQRQSLWPFGVLLALLIVLLEWVVYVRKSYV